MRKLRHIINGVFITVVIFYLAIVVLLHIPAIQGLVGASVGKALSKKLGTTVAVGRVNLGFLNRIIIDDVLILDQQKKEMLRTARLSAKFDYAALLNGKVYIYSAQLFGLKAKLYQSNAQTPANFQFVLDSLASKDTTTHTPIDLKINTLIIRRGSIRYDRQDVPPSNRFSPHHLDLRDISAHLILNTLNDDSLNLNIRDIALNEASGLHLRSFAAHLTANRKATQLEDVYLQLPTTRLKLGPLTATYSIRDGQLWLPSLRFSGGIEPSRIVLSELSCFVPALRKSTKTLHLRAHFSGTSHSLRIPLLEINAAGGGASLLANGSVSRRGAKISWSTKIDRLRLSHEGIRFLADNFGAHFHLPPHLVRLGNIDCLGEASGQGSDVTAKGLVKTSAGRASIAVHKRGDAFSGRIETSGIDVGKILADARLGIVATRIDLDGRIPANAQPSVQAKGLISRIDYNGYSYQNISLDGQWHDKTADGRLQIEDPNANILLHGRVCFSAREPYAKLTADVRSLNPSALKLLRTWPNTQFRFQLLADITGRSLNTANGKIELTNFAMTSERGEYRLSGLFVDVSNTHHLHTLTATSDFGEFSLMGKYDYNTLSQSITNLIGSKLPTLPGLPHTTDAQTNNFSVSARIERTDWLQHLFNIPLELTHPLQLKGSMSDTGRSLDLLLQAPGFAYDGNRFEGGDVRIITINDTLNVSAKLEKRATDGKKLRLDLQTAAADNKLSSIIAFDNGRKPLLRGEVKTETTFFKDAAGLSTAHVAVKPSDILVGDTVWKVRASELTYQQNHLVFHQFAVSHNNQHIIIDGAATKNPMDSVAVELKDVDVNYILGLVDFHSVEFDGLATGTAIVKTPFTTPDAYARLKVRNFRFEGGDMGTLTADVRFNNLKGQIDIDAIANDGPIKNTFINGYVSPKHNYIDLGIRASNTNIAFLEGFCKSFMKDVQAQATGEVRLSGPLSHINLTGQLTANGFFTISSLNTTYQLKNAVVRMRPDEIELKGEEFEDRHGNTGILKGFIRHKHLTHLSYDLDIEARKLLVYDTKDFGEDTFYGTVFATGRCLITGKSGEVNIDITATPERNSTLVYNVSSPENINNNHFIHWASSPLSPIVSSIASSPDKETAQEEEEEVDIPTDIRLNFLVNCTPEATIKLMMDRQTGDYITLNGSGTLRATYYNKGTFDLFGNYVIDHGLYKLTIQNVIKKEFSFEQGSTIAFGGDPYAAPLNLKAIYTANGVSLSDLNIGRSFSNNTIRVNCLMNITGTPAAPKVAFDLDMPTVNSNVKQMIYSLINGEEEMNQQVLYLLAVGRFYTQGRNNADLDNANAQSQTSLAMQSLLSSTLSQQLNNVLGSVINNTNWNFGANISTGDEGWNNAEYEGTLSGRLLNNRLLINSQFGYRDNANATTGFIGDFDIRYLLFPSGSMAIKMYNQTNDRYFTRNSLNTQGIGLILKKDFNGWRDLFGWTRKRTRQKKDKTT